MTPRWHRTRWFWVGLLGLILWVAAWAASFAGKDGHVWSWNNHRHNCFFSHGAGWIRGGFGESQLVRYPGLRGSLTGWRHSTWDLSRQKKDPWFPSPRVKIEQGNARFWTHYSLWTAAWSIAWLVPLICWHRPRRIRPPRLPGTPRRWFTSPFLWAGLPGFIILVTLWIDSSTHRSTLSWKWTRGYKVEPNYLGFGVESNRGQAAIWTGRPYQGKFFPTIEPGLSHERKPSTGDFFTPDAKPRKSARTLHTTYLTLTSLYLLLWATPAALWQYRQSRLRHALARLG